MLRREALGILGSLPFLHSFPNSEKVNYNKDTVLVIKKFNYNIVNKFDKIINYVYEGNEYKKCRNQVIHAFYDMCHLYGYDYVLNFKQSYIFLYKEIPEKFVYMYTVDSIKIHNDYDNHNICSLDFYRNNKEVAPIDFKTIRCEKSHHANMFYDERIF